MQSAIRANLKVLDNALPVVRPHCVVLLSLGTELPARDFVLIGQHFDIADDEWSVGVQREYGDPATAHGLIVEAAEKHGALPLAF